MSAYRVHTLSLVPYQDLKTEGFTLMIVDSGHINCAMSHSEVRVLRKSVLACHLLSALKNKRDPACCFLSNIFKKA